MRLVLRLVGFLFVLVAVLAAVAYLLPRQVTVTREATIAAPPDVVFPWVNSLRKTTEWSPWTRMDPDIKLSFEGPDEGVGGRMIWTSADPKVGSGQQEITASTPNERVDSVLGFGGMGSATASMVLSPEGAGTRATWSLVMDMGTNPVGRWMGLMMDHWVGADYERGLASLKAKVEGG